MVAAPPSPFAATGVAKRGHPRWANHRLSIALKTTPFVEGGGGQWPQSPVSAKGFMLLCQM